MLYNIKLLLSKCKTISLLTTFMHIHTYVLRYGLHTYLNTFTWNLLISSNVNTVASIQMPHTHWKSAMNRILCSSKRSDTKVTTCNHATIQYKRARMQTQSHEHVARSKCFSFRFNVNSQRLYHIKSIIHLRQHR